VLGIGIGIGGVVVEVEVVKEKEPPGIYMSIIYIIFMMCFSPQKDEDLDAIIKRREQEKAVAQGRDFARRPTSYKTSLSVPVQLGTSRRRSRYVIIYKHII